MEIGNLAESHKGCTDRCRGGAVALTDAEGGRLKVTTSQLPVVDGRKLQWTMQRGGG